MIMVYICHHSATLQLFLDIRVPLYLRHAISMGLYPTEEVPMFP
jgi:hypothetical protein